MAASTGPVLAAAGIVVFNAVIVHDQTPRSQTRVMVGALIAVAGLAVAERAVPQAAVALSWLILAGTLLVRVQPNIPSPIESFGTWYNEK